MARISEEEISAVRSRADIVDVIGHYLQIQRKGKSYKAVCPFHDDHDPSLSINPDMQIYKCFVCGNGGNVFTFVQNFEKISFVESVVRVADLVGYPLSVDAGGFEKKKDPHREGLYNALNEMIRYTRYCLDTQEGADYRSYLEKRGLDAKICDTFNIGYNPAGEKVYQFLHAKGYPDIDLVGANIVRMTDRGMQDVFSGRITFAIHDENGNPIGFSARTLDPQNPSKYINTNDTDIFIKGDIVYNYHRARLAARRAGRIYVCEGVTDVIAFYRGGIENAVCTLGTSCTVNQIRLLKKIAAKVVFCYDGDKAGQAATWRAAKMAMEQGCEVAIVQNRTGLDPDEIMRENGSEALRAMLKEEISWMEFVLSYLAGSTNLSSYSEKKEMAEKAMAEINLLNDETDRRYFTEQLEKLTGLHLEYARAPKQAMPGKPVQKLRVPNGTRAAEEQILAMMIANSQAVRIFEDELGYLITPECQKLAMLVIDEVHTYEEVNLSRLIDTSEEEGIRNLITKLVTDESIPHEYDPVIMKGAMRKVKISVLNAEADAYKAQLTVELNPQSRNLIMDRYSNCLRELRRYLDEENNNEEK